MKAVKMASGAWRVTIYDYTDSLGKQHNKTFTGATKKEAEQKAANYRRTDVQKMHIAEVVKMYIDSRAKVISPSTLRAYYGMYEIQFEQTRFGALILDDVTNQDVQSWVSGLAAKYSPKSIKNIYGLFSASVKMFKPMMDFVVKLPQAVKPKLYSPTELDIHRILDACIGRPIYLPIMLGAFCGMRRGEICALKYSDIDFGRNTIHVSRSMVRTSTGRYTEKPPKTTESDRIVSIPGFVAEYIRKTAKGHTASERICPYTPDGLTNSFDYVVKKVGLPQMRFHDLRHFFATRLAYIGIPDKIICAQGGWKTDHVMKRVYVDVASDELQRSVDAMGKYFSKFGGDSKDEP